MQRLVRSKLFWAAGALLAALLLYLALGVFGVQTLFYDTEVNEDFSAETQESERRAAAQPADPELVSAGEFHAVAHPGTGDARVYRVAENSYVLRLENLYIYNGPDLYVYAVAARDANDGETVLESGFLNLGPLKGNRGNQTYELPARFDPDEHQSISIWCRRFSVNFATAPLQ